MTIIVKLHVYIFYVTKIR